MTGVRVEFVGALAETAVPALTVDGSGLAPADTTAQVFVEREGAKFAGEIVSKFTPEGALIESWGVDGELDGRPTLLVAVASRAAPIRSDIGGLERATGAFT